MRTARDKNKINLLERDSSYRAGKRLRHEYPRDVANFMQLRIAGPGDDPAISDLLTRTFLETYARKLPEVETTEERKLELRDVASKRRAGMVCVLEFGHRVVGTFSLIHPESPDTDSWIENYATLRCVAIDPEFHGLQFSQILLDESVRLACSWALSGLCLHVQKGAHKVASLYEKFGYVRDARGDKISNGQEIEGYALDFSRIL